MTMLPPFSTCARPIVTTATIRRGADAKRRRITSSIAAPSAAASTRPAATARAFGVVPSPRRLRSWGTLVRTTPAGASSFGPVRIEGRRSTRILADREALAAVDVDVRPRLAVRRGRLVLDVVDLVRIDD